MPTADNDAVGIFFAPRRKDVPANAGDRLFFMRQLAKTVGVFTQRTTLF